MPQHRHLTADVAELLTCYEELIIKYQHIHRSYIAARSQGYGGGRYSPPSDDVIIQLKEQAEKMKWRCLSKGYCDIETGWHKKKQKRFNQS